MTYNIKRPKSTSIIKNKFNQCIALLESGSAFLVKEYTHTAERDNKIIDYHHKYITDNAYIKIKLSIQQYNNIYPIAKKLGKFKLITDKKLKALFYNKIKRP